MIDAASLVDDISRRAALRGIDLSSATTVGRYNVEVDEPYRLPGEPSDLVVVLGNTQALWPHLTGHVMAAGRVLADPVDQYVEVVVGEIVSAVVAGDVLIDVRFAHEPPPRRIAIQRLAHVAGLAWLSPSHLCIHREYGPWIALRAAVVVALPGPEPRGDELTPPCDCDHHCLPELARALAVGEPQNEAELRDRWRLWLAVRDACPVGRAHRYHDEQIEYHYTGRRPPTWLV
jgi:methylmalonic aciduria homocystinuria type C protein